MAKNKFKSEPKEEVKEEILEPVVEEAKAEEVKPVEVALHGVKGRLAGKMVHLVFDNGDKATFKAKSAFVKGV